MRKNQNRWIMKYFTCLSTFHRSKTKGNMFMNKKTYSTLLSYHTQNKYGRHIRTQCMLVITYEQPNGKQFSFSVHFFLLFHVFPFLKANNIPSFHVTSQRPSWCTEFDSIITRNLSNILQLFCTPTWRPHHMSENREQNSLLLKKRPLVGI